MRRIVALLLTMVAVALTATQAFAADGGTIEGKVVNRSANGGSVADVEVTLTTYFGQTERNKATTKTDAEGSFRFTGLDTSANYNYEAATTYQKGDYSAPGVSFSGSGETQQVTLEVYDSTTDESVIKATAKHYVVTPNNGQLEVTEILVLNNSSDRTYVGSREISPDQRVTSTYEPPAGAKEVNYGDGLMSCCVVKDGAGFVDTMAINPGESQKIYTYKLPYDGTSLSFGTKILQPTDRVQFLVPSTGITASVSGLSNHGSQAIQGVAYQVFSGENLSPETTLQVDLQGLPEGPLAGGPIALAGVAFATLAALGGGFYVVRRRSQPAEYQFAPASAAPAPRRGKSSAAPRVTAANSALVELEKQELLTAMANLDDWFEQGRISRKDYDRLRSEKKERLLALGSQNGPRRRPKD